MLLRDRLGERLVLCLCRPPGGLSSFPGSWLHITSSSHPLSVPSPLPPLTSLPPSRKDLVTMFNASASSPGLCLHVSLTCKVAFPHKAANSQAPGIRASGEPLLSMLQISFGQKHITALDGHHSLSSSTPLRIGSDHSSSHPCTHNSHEQGSRSL